MNPAAVRGGLIAAAKRVRVASGYSPEATQSFAGSRLLPPALPPLRAIRNCRARAWRAWIVALQLLLGSWALALAQSPPAAREVELDAEERAFLATHPRLRVHTKVDWSPIDLYTYEGQYRGLSGDYLGLIERRLGIRFEYQASVSLAQALLALQQGQTDIVPSVARTPAREAFMAFSTAYLDVPNIYVARRGVGAVGPDETLAGLRVAVERGYAVKTLIRERHPGAELVEFDDSAGALRGVSEGAADVYLGSLPTTSFLVEKMLLTNLEVRSPLHSALSSLHLGVRRDNTVLLRILDKALATVTLAERQEIHRRWVPLHSLLTEPTLPLPLTAADRQFLAALPPLRVGFEADFQPYTFTGGDGRLAGMAADMLDRVRERIGLPLAQPQAMPWREVLARTRRGELDLLIAVSANAERERDLRFIGPWVSIPNVLVTTLDAAPVLALNQFTGRRVAVLRAGQTAFLLQRNFPGIERVELDGRDELLAAVVNGRADAAFVQAGFAATRLSEGLGARLKMAGFFPELNSDLYFAVRRDQAELADLLARALASVSSAERAAIASRWASLPMPQAPSAEQRELLRRLMVIGLVILVLAAVSVAWALRLKREVARRTRAEQSLAAERDRAEELATARERFLAEASHEIRTPVNAVVGALAQLQGEGLTPRAANLATVATRAAQTLSSYVNNLLDLSKADAGRLQLVLQPESLRATLLAAVDAVRPLAQGKGLALRLDTSAQIAERHRFDALRLHQVLLNLLSNAVRFTERGEVALQAELLQDQGTQQRLRLTVRDTGIGIDPAVLPQLFQAFEQGGASLAHRQGGSGLGLALSQRLVQAMGGQIGLAAAEGGGTMATVELSLEVVAPGTSSAADATTFAAPGTALLVEDDRVQQVLAGTLLERAGWRLEIADDLASARELWQPGRFQLVLCDLNLPDGHGAEFATWLRQQPGGETVRLVAHSADLDDAERALAAGFERVFAKPLTQAQAQALAPA